MHPKYSALFTSVNLLLGVGPLILPMPFFEAGIVLAIIWMVIITWLSYNSAMFISEAMAKLHQIQHNRSLLRDGDRGGQVDTGVGGSDMNKPVLADSLISSQQQDLPADELNKNLLPKPTDQEQQKPLLFDHSNQFQILFGPKWGIFPCIAISVYLLGTSISKCIMTGKIMSKVFGVIEEGFFTFLGNFNFWIFVFFLSGAAFSFRSIDKTKIMQIIIVAMRVISIVLFIFGAVFLFCRDGIKSLTPKTGGVVNFSQFVSLFSNSVFSFMFHHSLPNIVIKLDTTEDVRFVVQNAFLISGTVLMIIPVTGVMAFGEELVGKDSLTYYNFDFEKKIPFIYWITSFYVFLNVAAFSVYIIVIRTNILHILYPKINPKTLSKHTVISSILILAIILLSSWQLQDKIQIVLDFTGGIFGIVILFLIPCIEVYKAREMIYRRGDPRNYVRWLPIAVGVLGVGFMVFNLYRIIEKLVNQGKGIEMVL